MVMRLALLLAVLAPAAARSEPLDCTRRLLPPPGSAAPVSRAVAAADLIELRDLGPPGDSPSSEPAFALSPDGRWIAFAIRRASIASNSYCYGVVVLPPGGGAPWLIDVGGEPLIAITDYLGMADKPNGVVTASPIAWSPDGRWVAYLRRDHGRTRLWRAAADGAGAEPLTREAVDVRSFAWAADGRSIRFAIRPAIEQAAEAAREEGRQGYLFDRRFWPVIGAEPMPPSDTPMEWRSLDLASRNVTAAPDPNGERADMPGELLSARAADGALAWTSRRDPQAFLGSIQLAVRIGGRERACLSAGCPDRVAGLWWESPGTLLFLRDMGIDHAGTLALYRWRPGGGQPRRLFEIHDLLVGCALRGKDLICACEQSAQPRRIVAVATGSGAVRTLFDPNPEWGSLRTGPIERLPISTAGGAATFADLVLPPSHHPGERHPLVVVQYQSRGFLRGGTGDEYPVQLLASRGFAVLSFQRPAFFATGARVADANAYQRLNVANWADRARVDAALRAGIAAAVARGVVDPDRIGITGLSDGTNTVAYALLNGGGFRAAVLSTCCDDPSIAEFASGPDYASNVRAWGYPAYGEDGEAFWKPYSLARGADRVRTPLLIQASDREYRLALETVAALRAAGSPVEMIVFPDEYHIKWQPEHRLAVYDRVIDWFGFWLKDEVDPMPGKAAQYRRWREMAEASRSRGSAPVP